ncbi:MAG: hypothetical protein A2V67_03980 [Deltaproteobacteria bacterium RBG_13_61_14]|nr:MAG: hypothetical protein A2V67_03980 [Deltaproteobacteria bacterium RBG_13_61_14]
MDDWTDEQTMMREMVRRLAREKLLPLAARIDEEEVFPEVAFRALAGAKLFALAVPERYGGAEADVTTLCLVMEELAKVSPACGLMVFSTQAVYRALRECASPEQADRFFPDMGQGDKLASFVLTEPDFGSDAASLRTRAERRGDGYLLNGAKVFITSASAARYFLVFARTGPGEREQGISAFLILRDTPGLVVGKAEDKMGLRGSMTNQVILEDARVSAANRIGQEGEGWKILTEVANVMRLWGAASMALGIAEAALECAVAYARERKQFGRPIAGFQALRFMLADMAILVEASRSLIYSTAGMIDQGRGSKPEIESRVSMAKCFASDAAMKVTTDAVQILGGYGYTRDYPVERMMRDAKALQILDGTNQIQRIVIARNLIQD